MVHPPPERVLVGEDRNVILLEATDGAGNVGTHRLTVHFDPSFNVLGGATGVYVVTLLIVIAFALVLGFRSFVRSTGTRGRRRGGGGSDGD